MIGWKKKRQIMVFLSLRVGDVNWPFQTSNQFIGDGPVPTPNVTVPSAQLLMLQCPVPAPNVTVPSACS